MPVLLHTSDAAGGLELGGDKVQMRQQALQTGLTLCGQGAAGHKRCSAEGSGKLQALPPCYLATVLFCRCRGEGKGLIIQHNLCPL